MKLEIKHLAPYLPYGLRIEHPTMMSGNRKISEMRNLGQTSIEISHRIYVQISSCKPLLRPLSDLTKEIEINGKKFVPIVELAKLAYPDLVWEFDRTRAISEWNNERAYFFFNKNSFFACFFNNSIPNQLDLFQKLFEWNFDVFGLINQGLAIPLI